MTRALRALAEIPGRIVARLNAPPRWMAWLNAGRRYVAHTTRRVRTATRARRRF